MPRAKSKKPVIAKQSDWRDRMHYVNLSYNEELEIREWLSGREGNQLDYLDEMIEDGWGVKMTPRKDGRGITTSVTCNDSDHALDGHTYMLTYGSVRVGIMVAYWLVREFLADEKATPDLATGLSKTFDDLL